MAAPQCHRQRAVLQAILSADAPVDSKVICRAIERPWYGDPKRFRASVSSTLGLLRSKGLIACQEIRDEPHRYFGWRRRNRRWFLTRAGVGLLSVPEGDFYTGGRVVGSKGGRVIGDRVQHDLWPYQRKAMDRIMSLDPRNPITLTIEINPRKLPGFGGKPRTDDMKQMLDDLGITPPPTFADYKDRIQREIARGFGVPRDRL